MMECLGIAMLLMAGATLGVHLGLPQAIAAVLAKICKCHKCLSFWTALVGLLAAGCSLAVAVLLSLLAAYASNWMALIFILLNNGYNKIWRKLNK